jgi:hypothetical protein
LTTRGFFNALPPPDLFVFTVVLLSISDALTEEEEGEHAPLDTLDEAFFRFFELLPSSAADCPSS